MTDSENHRSERVLPRLGDKINELIAITWPDKRKRPGFRAIAKRIAEEGPGGSLSGSYLWLLATGQRDNPTVQQIESLAEFFKVSPSYFFDDQTADEVKTDRQMLAALRERGVLNIALRSDGLSAKSQQAILQMIDRAREIERLDPVDSPQVEQSGRGHP
jgi:transcriptional regulator with XRE-family HTH domain